MKETKLDSEVFEKALKNNIPELTNMTKINKQVKIASVFFYSAIIMFVLSVLWGIVDAILFN